MSHENFYTGALNCTDNEMRCRVSERCVLREFSNTDWACEITSKASFPCRKSGWYSRIAKQFPGFSFVAARHAAKRTMFFDQSANVCSEKYFTFFSPKVPLCKILGIKRVTSSSVCAEHYLQQYVYGS